jgi:CBS domain-containing protein/gamma-glutamylcysteine synthetase
MGEHNVEQLQDDAQQRAFMGALLSDIRAFERMLELGLFESGVRRIGAEQEMFLVERESLRPAPVAMEVLERAGDARLTTEIARFNLEANLTPLDLGSRCFHLLEEELEELLTLVREKAGDCGVEVLLAGILPTLSRSDLRLENITPSLRYHELNRAICQLRGNEFSIHIKGLDELHLTHNNVMMEACNTSFQVHLQVGPEEFARLYNYAQAITAPVLAAAVNSPLLFGRRLWSETRLALFQHSVDERSAAQQVRQRPTRVGFGDNWVKDSVLEIFREDIARFRVIMTKAADEDPLAVLDRGEIPKLSALRLHNGTIWRWNRPCYGVANGRPHLRIENRALPSGPSILDEVANAAFFVGLMIALPEEYGEIESLMSFDDAKSNFFAAARHGLDAQFSWIGVPSISVPKLILNHLLPFARAGLKQAKVEAGDVDRYLGTIEERVRSGQTGAKWCLSSLRAMGGQTVGSMRDRRLTAEMLSQQQKGEPVHRWPIVHRNELKEWRSSYQTVGQFMSTDLFTVRPDDLVDLAASVMQWRHVRHVPVEDDEGHLVGLVSHRNLLRLIADGSFGENAKSVVVREIMKPSPLTASPDTPTLEAIRIMRSQKVGCLPVVEEGRLVGIVTSYDFLAVSAQLFEDQLNSQQGGKKQTST